MLYVYYKQVQTEICKPTRYYINLQGDHQANQRICSDTNITVYIL